MSEKPTKARSAAASNFVISTGAKRSGEICGFPHLAQRARQIWGTLDWWWFWMHTSSRLRVAILAERGWPPQPLVEQASESAFLHSSSAGTTELWMQSHLICHLDRSEAQWRDLRFPTSGAKSAPDMGHPRLVVVLDAYFKQIEGAPSLRSKGRRPQPLVEQASESAFLHSSPAGTA